MTNTAGAVSTQDTGPYPIPSDIDNAVATLTEYIGSRRHQVGYAYLVGYLDGIIASLAELHARCRIIDCRTCWHLRRARALLTASQKVGLP